MCVSCIHLRNVTVSPSLHADLMLPLLLFTSHQWSCSVCLMYVMINSHTMWFCFHLILTHFPFYRYTSFPPTSFKCANDILKKCIKNRCIETQLLFHFKSNVLKRRTRTTANMSMSEYLCFCGSMLNCVCVFVCVCDCGGGRWVTELEEAPNLSEQSSSTSWNMERTSFCYHRVTVEGGEEVFSLSFFFLSPKQKDDPLLSFSAGGALVEPSSSPSETPGRRSTSSPPLLASSLVSFHHPHLPPASLVSFPSLPPRLELTLALIWSLSPPKKLFSSPFCHLPFVSPSCLSNSSPLSPSLSLPRPVISPLICLINPLLFTTS